MEDNITPTQLREWLMFFQVEPWGSEIEWARFGTVAAMVGNMAPNRKQTAKMFKPTDFTPNFKPSREKHGKPNTKALRADFIGAFAGRIKHAKKDGQ